MKKRIVHIITRADTVGGPHVTTRDLCLEARKEGCESIVFMGQGGKGPYQEDLEYYGVPYIGLKYLIRPIAPIYDILGVFEIRYHLARLKPHLVVTHSSKAGILGRIAAFSLAIPVIFHIHGWAFTYGIPLLHRMVYILAEKMAAPFTHLFIPVSKFDQQLGRRYRIGKAHKMITIHNGRKDMSQGQRAAPAKSPPRLIMVGRLEKQKDHKTLFYALSGLKHKDWQLELVGEGPLKEDLCQLAKSLGIFHRIHFSGFLPHHQVLERLLDSQIFLLISLWEGFPCSILEAMMMGLPVVVTQAGGSAEAVEEGVTGFVISKKDVQTLQNRLEYLIDHPEKRKEMGIAGRKRYEEKFSFEIMYAKTMEAYRQVWK